MATDEKRGMSEEDAALHARLRSIGFAMLVAGLFAAALVQMTAAPDDEFSLADTKRDEYEMERLGGKGNVMASDFREWFNGLWHGHGLAHMLVFVSIASFLACFFLAHRLKHHAPGRRGSRPGA